MKKTIMSFVIVAILLLAGTKPVFATEQRPNTRIMLTDYKIKDGILVPGQEAEITYNFINPSKTTNVGSFLVEFLTQEQEMIYPSYGESNQHYVKSLDAGKKLSLTVHFNVSENVTTTMIPLRIMVITMDSSGSDDSSGTNINTITVNLPVQQKSNFLAKDIKVTPSTNEGGQTLVSYVAQNSGNEVINNIVMVAENEETGEKEEFNLPTLNAQESRYSENYLSMKSSDSDNIKVTFLSVDAEGKSEELSSNSYEVKQVAKQSNAKASVSTNGKSKKQYIFIGVGILFLMVMISVVFKNIGKKNRYQ